jgi:LysM repeat protein
MNPTNPNQSHSPLVPQGSIPPKNTSRSSQVLLIAATVVFFHVAGFAVVLMQGCQKDAKTAGSTNNETNSTAGLSLPPMDTNAAAMFTTNAAPAPTTVYTPPTGNVNVPTPEIPGQTLAGSTPGYIEPPTSVPPQQDAGMMSDYKVQPGDSFSRIAAKHHITVTSLTKANPGIDPRKLQAGKTIKVPAVPLPAIGTPAPSANSVSAPSGPTAIATGGAERSGGGTYVVRGGDTLTKIARNNGITVSQLRAANNMKTTRVLVGQKLKIPARTQSTAAASDTNAQH